MGGGKGKGKGKKNKKKSGKSGNPMKREAEEKALRDKLAGKVPAVLRRVAPRSPRSRRIRRFLPDCRICWAIPASCRRTWVVACPVCCTKPRYVRLPAITTTGNRNTAYITKLRRWNVFQRRSCYASLFSVYFNVSVAAERDDRYR